MQEVKVPVVIIGGGGCGLVSSSMLSNLGVEHVLLESHPSTAHLPKASLLNQRSAEILDQHGLWESITEIGCPPELMKYYYYVTSLGGDGPTDRITLEKLPCYGCNNDPGMNDDYPRYRRDSPYLHCNLPLIRLEPVLRSEAETRNPGRVLFNHKAIAFQEFEDHVIIQAVNGATGEEIKYIADYVIAADGGKTFAPTLGIHYEGARDLADTTTVHFKADLSKYWQDGALMNWTVGLQGQDGALSTSSALFGADWSAIVMTGPTWGKESEEWVFHLGLGQKHLPLEELTEDLLKGVIKRSLKLPDLNMEILKTTRWKIDGIYALQYQTNRIFLAGDAAHRHPPITGLGLNTALGDAHNLTWKLAAVLKDEAPTSLLRSYEKERLPVGKRVVEWALFAFMNIRVIDSAFGLIPGGQTMLPTNERIYEQVLADTYDGAVRRAAIRHAVSSQRVEVAAHDLELGSVYAEGALMPDCSVPPAVDPRGFLYVPAARPGHRLPHAWLKGPTCVSTHHLIDNKGGWVFFSDDSDYGKQWTQKSLEITRDGAFPVRVIAIGPSGDFQDQNGQWTEVCGLKPDAGGGVLVRPDTYVAFRAPEFSAEAVARLDQFLLTLRT